MPADAGADRNAGGNTAAAAIGLGQVPAPNHCRSGKMTAGTRTFSLEETLLEPPALPPPPTRHALFVILIASAALLHMATIGTGDLYSQTEGQYAGAAREMVESHQWLLPTND